LKAQHSNSVSGGYFVGIDIGSVSSCVLAIHEDTGETAFQSVFETGHSASMATEKCLLLLSQEPGIGKSNIIGAVATGFGRHSVRFADKAVSEISCHAKGILVSALDTRTLIDIGGQDSKVICLSRDGGVQHFLMNDRCAAGTGRFVETMAKILGNDLTSLNHAALCATDSLKINATCTVFAESEIVSLISDNVPVGEIMAAVFRAIAKRTAGMTRRVGVKPPFSMSGGVGMNPGLVKELEKILQHPVRVAQDSQTVGALGAALIAYEAYRERKTENGSIFKFPEPVQEKQISPTVGKKVKRIRRVANRGEKFMLVLCSCFPREILHGLGLPNRVVENMSEVEDSVFTELHPQICTVVGSKLGIVLKTAEKDNLLGLLSVDTCDAKRRLYDHLKITFPDQFISMVAMPPRGESYDLAFYTESLRNLSQRLAVHFKRTLSEDTLWRAIESTNRVRALFRDLIYKRRTGVVQVSEARLTELFKMAFSQPPDMVAASIQSSLEVATAKEDQAKRLPSIGLIGSCAGSSRISEILRLLTGVYLRASVRDS